MGKLFRFYNHYVEELERAINEEQWKLTEPEQWLLVKSRAERAYRYQLLVKHGFTIYKDIAEIMKSADMDDDIHKYESLPPVNVNLIQS